MAKRTSGAKKAGGKKKGGKKKKGGARASLAKRKRMTLHGVYDVIDAFERSVQRGSHPMKADMLKLAADSKAAVERFCRALREAGHCRRTPDFCEPIP